tara:strand:- start:1034 stop:1741 length:708 start_codon:yes stop_codon:yes gene_type:complete
MSELVLPKQVVKAARKSPKNMIIYGPPKIGKTTALSQLENCLIIDLEDGSDMVDALKIKVNSLAELAKVGQAIISEGKPYKYIAIDTITQLEVWCEDEAKKMYQATPMGKNFDQQNKGLSVLTLPQGAGYLYLRKAFMKWFFRLSKLADHVIFVGHLKDKYLTKNGKEVKANDLSLSGKLREITCANADAIGLVYRGEETTKISFDSTSDDTAGSRCEHLRGLDAELDWSKIFID